MNQALPIALLALLPSTTLAQSGQPERPARDIVETALAAGQFKTLAAALQAAGLVDTLRGRGPFTVFAPTDKAFAALPAGTVARLLEPQNKARLTAVLTYHVLPGAVGAAQAIGAGQAKTLQGDEVRIALVDGRLRVNEATVVTNDVRCSNGVIHIIDSVLLPPAPPAAPTRPEVLRKIISDAIQSGVPLFNAGQPGACAALYRLAAYSVRNLGADSLQAATVKALQRALDGADGRDTTDDAWTLRFALDAALRDLDRPAPATSKTSTTKDMQTKTLFSFEDVADRAWRTVNDDVMGGVSKGGIAIDVAKGTATFAGQLSRRNNGGFASVRSRSRDLDLADYEGLIVRVKGDGRTYRVQALAGDNRWRPGVYQQEFSTRAGEWQEIRVPFGAMEYSVRGRRLPTSPLQGSQIRSLGFSIADKDESPFSLQVDWIKAYRTASSVAAD